jgi:hypothetical protein
MYGSGTPHLQFLDFFAVIYQPRPRVCSASTASPVRATSRHQYAHPGGSRCGVRNLHEANGTSPTRHSTTAAQWRDRDTHSLPLSLSLSLDRSCIHSAFQQLYANQFTRSIRSLAPTYTHTHTHTHTHTQRGLLTPTRHTLTSHLLTFTDTHYFQQQNKQQRLFIQTGGRRLSLREGFSNDNNKNQQ